MAWSDQVFRRYCERGQDPAFWAEPFNALSNAGFVVVAIMMLWQVSREIPKVAGADRLVLQALSILAATIGIGSFLFHTFATRWALLADVVPIMIFMAVYLGAALRLFLELSWGRIAVSIAGFVAISIAATRIVCPATAMSITDAAREPCLKGTIGYVPALAALLIVGALLRRGHIATSYLVTAAAIFLGAMTLRWLDRDVCAATVLLGKVRGTHALWHLLNAATIGILIRAAIAVVKQRYTGRKG